MQFMVSMITDGPFAESKEQFAGYMVLECEDLDGAVRWLERMPVVAPPSRCGRSRSPDKRRTGVTRSSLG
jgi:hypothetical protein